MRFPKNPHKTDTEFIFEVDQRFDKLILRALENDPRDRFQRASELRIQVEAIAGVGTRLSPEVSRKLSYEYRTKTTVFGWPLLHVATGVNPATGRRRSAKGIIAIGTAPQGVIAFGDVAVGVVACGIFGYGLVSISIVAVGIVACGSVVAALLFGMGGLVVAPVALGGASFGWYSNGAIAWGKHVLAPNIYDAAADKFFNPRAWKLTAWIFRAMIVAVPLFLALGFLPSVMAKIAERRARRARQPLPQQMDK